MAQNSTMTPETASPSATALIVGETVRVFTQHMNITPEKLPLLVAQVYETVVRCQQSFTASQEAQAPQEPAVAIEDSVQGEYIVCLEDGTRHKMMKRYLRAKFGMEPDEYRQKWNLPKNYPMVAPNYSSQKRLEAVAAKLGHYDRVKAA